MEVEEVNLLDVQLSGGKAYLGARVDERRQRFDASGYYQTLGNGAF